MPQATFLLPARARFGGQRLSHEAARALGRADSHRAEQGDRAQLRRHFTLVPDHWPLAALARRVDANDAETACWLRADPAHVRPDINGARLLACGDGLQLTRQDVDALLPALKPVFGDVGFPIDAPVPGHWYLRLPREARPPAFAEPSQALGGDVSEQVPEGDAGRRWRVLLSEAQVVLHNHPHNDRRIAEGRPAVNSLWFWGGGILPDVVRTTHARAWSDDETLRALAHGATAAEALPARFEWAGADALVDLRHLRDVVAFEQDWLEPARRAVGRAGLDAIVLDFADGHVAHLAPRQRWRFWRKPLARLAPDDPS